MINVLFAARPHAWEAYRTALPEAFAEKGLTVDLRQDFPPAQVDYIVYAPNSPCRTSGPTRARRRS
jgi:glyoxylate/hydroxypyruvate reductase